MFTPIILVPPSLAAAPPKPNPPKTNPFPSEQIWMGVSGVLLLLLIALGVFTQLKIKKLTKQINSESFKNRELKRQYKMAVETVAKMEKNPDLIHSREFNLDYLRLRMAEEVFHVAIVNQIKVKVKDQISVALRPVIVGVGEKNVNASGRQIDAKFDVEYDTKEPGTGKISKRVLFRIEIRLMKLPTQTTSATIKDIINCLETYLSPTDEHDNWTPTIQGRIVLIDWDQKAKPTPLLVLEQSSDGVNVTFRPKRSVSNTSLDAGETTAFSTPPSSNTQTRLKKK
jgi:hypothetical protein